MRDLSFTAAAQFRSPESLIQRLRARRQATKSMTRTQLRLRLRILDALAQSAAADDARATERMPSL